MWPFWKQTEFHHLGLWGSGITAKVWAWILESSWSTNALVFQEAKKATSLSQLSTRAIRSCAHNCRYSKLLRRSSARLDKVAFPLKESRSVPVWPRPLFPCLWYLRSRPGPQTQTPSAKGRREAQRGSDRRKSSNPLLRAVASAEETLEDRDKKIWAHSSGMEDVWRCSQRSLLPAPSPVRPHSPTLIAWSPVIVARAATGSLQTVSPPDLRACTRDRGGTEEWHKDWEEQREVEQGNNSDSWVSNNETRNRLRFAVAFPDFQMSMNVLRWLFCFNVCFPDESLSEAESSIWWRVHAQTVRLCRF